MKFFVKGDGLITQNVPRPKSVENSSLELNHSSLSYHELPGLRHETKDVLKQLDSNLRLLEDLGGRISFVLGDVHSLIRR